MLSLVCPDGEAVVPKNEEIIAKLAIFRKDPDLATKRSYELLCQPRVATLNLFLRRVYDTSEDVTVDAGNVEELQNLSKELGFSGLDKDLEAFRFINKRKDKLALQERLTRHDKLFVELQRELYRFMNEQRKAQSELQQKLESLDRRLDAFDNVFEERKEACMKTESGLETCGKQSDVEKLARGVAQLREREKKISAVPGKASAVPDNGPIPDPVRRPPGILAFATHAKPPNAKEKSSFPLLRPSTPGTTQGRRPSSRRVIRARGNRKEFVYNDMRGLDGVIAYLTRECGGNVHDKGIVNVRASSIAYNNYKDNHPKHAADLGTDSRYESGDERNSWICYDLRNWRVIPKSYAVRSGVEHYGHHLRSWVFEVSQDGTFWTEVDRHDDSNDLNEKFITRNFEISHVPIESFRFLRLRQTGRNFSGQYYIRITALEIFGTLLTADKIEQPNEAQREFLYQVDSEEQSPPKLFPPKLNGIIAHLTLECWGNVHDKGIVHVIASRALSSYKPKHVLDFDKRNEFISGSSEEDVWLCYNFQKLRVIPDSYSVMADYLDRLESWIVEVSNDGNSWMEVDRRENEDDLKQKSIENFKIYHVPSVPVRFFRLRHMKKKDDGDYSMKIRCLEIFGTLSTAQEVEQPSPAQREIIYQADKEGQVPPPLVPPKLDGIIAYLTLVHCGNVHDRGIVNVTASSVHNEDSANHPRNALELGTNSPFISNDEQNAWICYDFRDRRVIPKSYSIRSCDYKLSANPKSWVFEVSDDGGTWTEVDCRKDNEDLKFSDQFQNFEICNIPSERVRFIRLRQTGKNHCGDHRLQLTSLEIFGDLFE